MSELIECAPPQFELYQAVLGMPFANEYVQPTVYSELEHDVVDVRVYAHQVVMGAAARLKDKDGNAIENIDHQSKGQIGRVRRLVGRDLEMLRRYVSLADNLAAGKDRLQPETYDHPGKQARAEYQDDVIRSVLGDLQKVRIPKEGSLPKISEVLKTGVIAVAPTGFGKTYVAARVLEAAGVGRRPAMSGDERPVSALVVVPNVELVKQYTADKNNIFRDIIGYDVPIGAYWGREKNIDIVTVITQRSFQLALKNEVIKRGQFDMMVFDEVHHGLGHQTFETLQHLASGMLGLTATPAYSESRDVRHWFPSIEVGSLLQFAEEGILNAAELYTFKETAGCSVNRIATSLATQYIREGRQTIIYCQKGNQSLQARIIANVLNTNARKKVAQAIGSFAKDGNDAAIDAFRRGDIQVLTTSGMLREGFDANVTAMISIGQHTSEVDLTQKAGRAMRPAKKISKLVEIWPDRLLNVNMVSLASIFGIENFTQGMAVGGDMDCELNLYSSRKHSSVDVPATIAEALIDPKMYRNILVGPDELTLSQTIPEDHTKLEDLAEKYHTHSGHLASLLEEANIGFLGVVARVGRSRELYKYYGPEAVEYLDANPPMARSSEAFLKILEVAELTGVSRGFLEKICNKNGIEIRRQLSREKNQLGLYLSREDAARALEAIDAIPQAAEDDVSIGTLSPLIPETFVTAYCEDKKIPLVMKRRHDIHGIKGFAVHVTAEEAAQMRATYDSRAKTEGYKSFKDIADAGSIPYASIMVRLTDEERAAVERRYVPTPGKRRLAYHLPEEVAKKVIERLSPKDLPLHLTSIEVMRQRLGKVSTSIHNYLGKLGDAHKSVVIGSFANHSGSRVAFYSWQTMAAMEKRVAPLPQSVPLNFDRLTEEAVKEPSNNLYAKIVQAYHMRASAKSEVYSVADISVALKCTFIAVKIAMGHVGITPEQFKYSDKIDNVLADAVLEIGSVTQLLPFIARAKQLDHQWMSHTQLAKQLRQQGHKPSAIESALEKVTQQHVRLGKNGNEVDVYYARGIVRSVAQALQDVRT